MHCHSALRVRSKQPSGNDDSQCPQACNGHFIPGCRPVDHDRFSLSGSSRREGLVLPRSVRFGRICIRRLVPVQFVSCHRAEDRTAVHDPRSAYFCSHRLAAAWRTDVMESMACNGRNDKRNSDIHHEPGRGIPYTPVNPSERHTAWHRSRHGARYRIGAQQDRHGTLFRGHTY